MTTASRTTPRKGRHPHDPGPRAPTRPGKSLMLARDLDTAREDHAVMRCGEGSLIPARLCQTRLTRGLRRAPT